MLSLTAAAAAAVVDCWSLVEAFTELVVSGLLVSILELLIDWLFEFELEELCLSSVGGCSAVSSRSKAVIDAGIESSRVGLEVQVVE